MPTLYYLKRAGLWFFYGFAQGMTYDETGRYSFAREYRDHVARLKRRYAPFVPLDDQPDDVIAEAAARLRAL